MSQGPDRPRRPRRAVRAPGGVGQRDEALVMRLPALPAATPADASRDARPPADAASPEAGVPFRSADDSDVGWGRVPQDSNDERLRGEKPPHW